MSHNTDFKTLQISAKDDCLYVFYRVNMQGRAGITVYVWFYVAVTSYLPSLEFRLFKLIILGGPPPVFQYRTRAVKLFVQMGNSKCLANLNSQPIWIIHEPSVRAFWAVFDRHPCYWRFLAPSFPQFDFSLVLFPFFHFSLLFSIFPTLIASFWNPLTEQKPNKRAENTSRTKTEQFPISSRLYPLSGHQYRYNSLSGRWF